jgi:hypothetical protein
MCISHRGRLTARGPAQAYVAVRNAVPVATRVRLAYLLDTSPVLGVGREYRTEASPAPPSAYPGRVLFWRQKEQRGFPCAWPLSPFHA